LTPSPLEIDGSHGEGGGQILRTSLALAALTGRGVRLARIRAGRRNPGLMAQHLTVVRAMAAVCGAHVQGDALGSTELAFDPGPVRSGSFRFDVADAREGGSAGAATLVVQALLPVLAAAQEPSTLIVRGGTHMAWSPPFDFLDEVWLVALRRMGLRAELVLERSGWFPVGEGEVRATVEPSALRGIRLEERGDLRGVRGRALAANLPAHIPQRMVRRAVSLLRDEGLAAKIEPQRLRASCAGAGIFLTADYDGCPAACSALGKLGKSSEAVAEEAVAALLRHDASGAPVDEHLADQLLVPMALASGESSFRAATVSSHLETNRWVIERFCSARILVAGDLVRVT